MGSIKLALLNIKKNFKNEKELKSSFIISVVGMAINNIAFLILWYYFGKTIGELNGWKPMDIFGLYGFGTTSYGIVASLFSGMFDIPNYISSGNFDKYLLTPKNILLKVSTSKISTSAFGDLLFGIVCFIVFFMFICLISKLLLFSFDIFEVICYYLYIKGEIFMIEELLEKLSVKPTDMKLYRQAFVHTSYAYEHNVVSYETLEFLGDAIVDLIISDYLYKANLYTEGEMTKIRASYVCENALYEYAKDLNFSKYIKVGVGETRSDGSHKKAIMADVFEALMGAIYLDLGYEKVKEVGLKIIVPYIEDKNILLFNDYKSTLQEAVQTDKKSLEYEIIDESGPAHNKVYKACVKVDGISLGEGVGESKKEAEQNAAKDALSILSK